jgi:hypothetical protein
LLSLPFPRLGRVIKKRSPYPGGEEVTLDDENDEEEGETLEGEEPVREVPTLGKPQRYRIPHRHPTDDRIEESEEDEQREKGADSA